MRLLLAEDEKALSRALTAILERNNYSVDPVYDGQATLDYLKAGNYDGIILEAFGCGGIPNQERSLLPCLKKAQEKGVIVVIVSQCPYEAVDLTIYDVNVQAARLGAVSGLDMTLETVTAKLMWVLAHTIDPETVKTMMHTCYAGEFTI